MAIGQVLKRLEDRKSEFSQALDAHFVLFPLSWPKKFGTCCIVFDGESLRELEPEMFAALLASALPPNSIIHDTDGLFLRQLQTYDAVFDRWCMTISNEKWQPVKPGDKLPLCVLQIDRTAEGNKECLKARLIIG